MKHNNLKKPAAVLTALALAAALLAGCGAPSDSMAASSAPAESEAVSTEAPAESADDGDADEVAAKKCADLIDAIYVQERNEDTDAQCEAAKAAWDALTDTQKALVSKLDILTDAEAKLAQLKKDAEKPSQPEQPAKPGEDANKPATGDAGVALWLTVMCMTSLLGAALVGKKRKA